MFGVPPLGSALSMIGLIYYELRGPTQPPTFSLDSVSPGVTRGIEMASTQVAVSQVLAKDIEVQPLIDILHSDDLGLKASAIDIMTRLSGKELVIAMKSLLTAPESDIRFQASVGLGRLEAQINETISEGEARVQRSPSSSEARRQLAQRYLDYVESGLPDGPTMTHYARMGADEFDRAESLDPSRSTGHERARCYAAAKDFEACLTATREAQRRNDDSPEVVVLRAQALYSLGRYQEVRQQAALVGDAKFDDPIQREIMEWWAST